MYADPSTKAGPGLIWKMPEQFSAFWNDQTKPDYLNPSGAKYARASYEKVLSDRGITNRLLDSLYYALGPGVIIAGGFMTAVVGENKDAKDIDLFFTSEAAFKRTVLLLLDPSSDKDFDDSEGWAILGYKPDEVTAKALDSKTFGSELRFFKFVHEKRPPIQLIKLWWYTDAEQVIDSFDLTLAQFALDCGTGDLVFNPISIMDVMRKRIVLHRMQYPASTLRRIIKYAHKGYYACPGSLTKIAEECGKGNPDDNKIVYID